MTKEQLKCYLMEEAEHTQQELDNMSNYELLDAWLTWNGIIGYTDDLVNIFEALTGTEL